MKSFAIPETRTGITQKPRGISGGGLKTTSVFTPIFSIEPFRIIIFVYIYTVVETRVFYPDSFLQEFIEQAR